MNPLTRWLRPMPSGAFWILLGLYVVLRLWMATLPGYENDLDSYKEWALDVARAGIPKAYEASRVDYPPLYLYLLYATGRLQMATVGDTIEGTFFTVLIKLPLAICDLLIGLALCWAVSRRSYWGGSRSGVGWGRWAAVLYWFNPAVLFDSAHWGQADAIHTLLATLALLLAAESRWTLSGVALSAAGLMKPLAAPLVPLLALASLVYGGWRGFLRCGLGGLGAAVLLFSPYWATGRIVPVAQKVFSDLQAMPFTTNNGHTIWWIVRPWRLSSEPWRAAGGLTPNQLALSAFGLVLVGLLAAFWLRGRRPVGSEQLQSFGPRLFLFAAATTATFFALSTHMHENHLFMAIPFLLAVAGRAPHLAWLFLGCTLASFLNMALHDPELPYRLPGLLSAPSTVIDPHLGRRFTWIQFVGSFLNATLVLFLAGALVHAGARRPSGASRDAAETSGAPSAPRV